MSQMWTLKLLPVLLCLGCTQTQGRCATRFPVLYFPEIILCVVAGPCPIQYQERPILCGSICILQSEAVVLNCSVLVNSRNSSATIQWFTTSTIDWSIDRTHHDTVAEGTREQHGTKTYISSMIKIPAAVNYWWCRVMEYEEISACPVQIPVVRLFPCSCNQRLETESLHRCPESLQMCDSLSRPQDCRRDSVCLENVLVEQSLPRNNLSTYARETKTIKNVNRTRGLLYQTPAIYTDTSTTTQIMQSATLTPDDVGDSTASKLLSNSVVRLMYTVGLVVCVIVITIVLLFVAIACIRHKRQKYRIRGGEIVHVYSVLCVFSAMCDRPYVMLLFIIAA